MQEIGLDTRYPFVILAFVAAAILIIGCATASELDATADHTATRGVDEAALRRGKVLAMTECTECHRYHWPHEYSAEEWPGIVKRMGKRAALSVSQTEDVELYFVTMCGIMQGD